MAWLAIRVRGTIHAHRDVLATFRELRLNRPNHATVLPEEDSYRGMLTTVQGYITWGPVSEETVELLLKGRGKLHDGNPVDGKQSKEFAGKMMKSGMREVKDDIRPLFRLKAPTGGWRSTKKTFTMGGALGYRKKGAKDDMDALARRML